MIRISNGIHIFIYVCQYELRWIDLLVLPQHRKKEKDWLFQATKSGESREEMLLKVLLVRPFELDQSTRQRKQGDLFGRRAQIQVFRSQGLHIASNQVGAKGTSTAQIDVTNAISRQRASRVDGCFRFETMNTQSRLQSPLKQLWPSIFKKNICAYSQEQFA